MPPRRHQTVQGLNGGMEYVKIPLFDIDYSYDIAADELDVSLTFNRVPVFTHTYHGGPGPLGQAVRRGESEIIDAHFTGLVVDKLKALFEEN